MRARFIAFGVVAVLSQIPGMATVAHAAPAPRAPRVAAPRSVAAAQCVGDYADELAILSSRVREFERDPANQYSYCLRTTAVYECLSYAPDGSIRRTRKTAVAHGTGFAFRKNAGETLLLTNDHVAEWPAVTDEEHSVEDVPSGCKLSSESVKIVDDEQDSYEANDVPLTRVVADPALDAAILKTKAPLKLLPYHVGRSAALHVGNVVAVHGFPLGAFAATNHGKVVNAYDHDTDKDWDHADFVVDALLSPGNSGSPVLAVSCRTGEYELVGIYHAGYVRGSALNVVVGIDQVQSMMNTLKRAPRTADAAHDPVGREARQEVKDSLAEQRALHFFPFGPLVASARSLPSGAVVFEVYSKGFPLSDERLAVIEDLPSDKAFGDTGRLYLGNERGLREWERGVLDADGQAQLDRVMARLRFSAVAAARFRAADDSTSKGHKRRSAIEHELSRAATLDRDASQALIDLADRLGPRLGDKTMAWRGALEIVEQQATAAAAVPAPSVAQKPAEPQP